MVALWFVGPTLENTLGRARYLTLYLMSAVGGSVASVLLATATDSWNSASLGASGAVFGLFGAILVVSKRLGGDVRGILVLIGINLALGFVMSDIAWQAHVGGLVTGGLLAAAYAYAPPPRRQVVAIVAPVTLGVALLVATLLTYASIGAFSF
jgi:membrane associated rhomboid family serine protease